MFIFHVQVVFHNHQIKYSITKQCTCRPNKIFSNTDFIFDFACLNFSTFKHPPSRSYRVPDQDSWSANPFLLTASVVSGTTLTIFLDFYFFRLSLLSDFNFDEKNKILESEVSHSIKSSYQTMIDKTFFILVDSPIEPSYERF